MPGGTQDKHLEHAKQAIKNDQPYIRDAPFYHSISVSAYRNKDNPNYKDAVEKFRVFLQESISKWLLTLSRVRYKADGKDLVIHNYGLQDKLEVQQDIVGPDGFITQTNPQKELNAVLGSNDINEIDKVYNWITGKNFYLYRVNKAQDTERVVRFNSSTYGTDLDCDRGPGYSCGALAVRAQKIR